MNNLQQIVKDNTRFAMHMAVELCEQGDYDSVTEAFKWLNQETVGNYTRWHELFGTPERAAMTAYEISEICSNDCKGCSDCPIESFCSTEDTLLEWLESEVRDD